MPTDDRLPVGGDGGDLRVAGLCDLPGAESRIGEELGLLASVIAAASDFAGRGLRTGKALRQCVTGPEEDGR